jgi:hypothetical protein
MLLACVSDKPSREERIAALVRQLDDLLDEAAELRGEALTAVRMREARPFWPDRRRTAVPHEPDRRAR